jgi:hypothetical protein
MMLDMSIIVTVSMYHPSHASVLLISTKAIPRITTDFHSLNDVGWYGSAYLLAK